MTNKELIDLLKCYPQDAEVQILNAGSWDDGERRGYDPAWKEIDPEEDLTYDSNTNELTIGTFG